MRGWGSATGRPASASEMLDNHQLRNQLANATGAPVTETVLFDFPTTRRLAMHFVTTSDRAFRAPPASSSDSQLPRLSAPAVCGLAALLPLGRRTPAASHAALATACDLLTQAPVERWDLHAILGMSEPARSRVRHGGFLCEAECFDAARFAVSSAEAAAMDPQQRLVLEQGYESLHSSGSGRAALDGSGAGVFLGIQAAEFGAVLGRSPLASGVYAATGAAHAIASAYSVQRRKR